MAPFVAIVMLAIASQFAHCFESYWEHGSADSPSFWDRTYRVQGAHGRSSYEWYGLGFKEIQPILDQVFPPVGSGDILVVGSGDSDISAELDQVGWNVTSIDFSETVTQHMQRRYPLLRFITMDARNMSFEDDHFVGIFDKGLSDCIPTAEEKQRYFKELYRVLHAEDGHMVVISQKLLSVPDDLGQDWSCKPVQELLGPLFFETTPLQPPKPEPGTERQISYYLLDCMIAKVRKPMGVDVVQNCSNPCSFEKAR